MYKIFIKFLIIFFLIYIFILYIFVNNKKVKKKSFLELNIIYQLLMDENNINWANKSKYLYLNKEI